MELSIAMCRQLAAGADLLIILINQYNGFERIRNNSIAVSCIGLPYAGNCDGVLYPIHVDRQFVSLYL